MWYAHRKYARAVRLPDDAGGDLPAASGVRAAMHPADQVEAFRRLADAGSTAAAIAARFGVSERTVEKRLRLGNAAPVLHEAYRAGEIDLDTLMAFAVTTDQARQNAVWETVGQQGYRPGAWQIKRLLTEDRVPATSAIVRFVGLEAYEAAGGRIDRDLFAEEDERGIWIDDPNLLNKLAMDSLQAAARELETRWKWAEARLDVDWSATAAFGRAARGPGASSRPRPDRASGRIGTNAPVVRPRAAFRRLSLVRRARARHRHRDPCYRGRPVDYILHQRHEGGRITGVGCGDAIACNLLTGHFILPFWLLTNPGASRRPGVHACPQTRRNRRVRDIAGRRMALPRIWSRQRLRRTGGRIDRDA